jgi:ElaB/YqjD/DUF883 family membrane-anchored ribosome-binding protein
MKRNHETVAQSPEALLKDLQALVAEAEKMVAGSTAEDNDLIGNIRDRFEAAQERFGDFYADAKKKITTGAKRTDEVIRANPYQSMAIALGVGLLLGVVVARRK